ncbi:MAG: ammonia-forming cytochrome c nitrite reductase subunit c552 [Tepidisphaerales bacterium]
MTQENQTPSGTGKLVGVMLVTAAITAGIAALLTNINERKEEGRSPFLKLVDVDENTVDAKTWGTNWPKEYDGYLRTSTPTHTKYGGGVSGGESDPPSQKAKAFPWLTRMFSGYLFGIDYRDRRGHAFMLYDQEHTDRNKPEEAKQSGNCLHCHASIMPLYRDLGRKALPNDTEARQIEQGLKEVGRLDYWVAHEQLEKLSPDKKAHPVGCVDCHDPKTMELRVTRPGFIKGIKALKKHEGNDSYEPNRDATRQEMRSFVCAQCHVEYYCGKGVTVFFPWNKGLKVEEIEAWYDSDEIKDNDEEVKSYFKGDRFYDWVHAETGAKVLKAQHPEFEVWSQGTHSKAGVACADCHMPYKREGSMKISEHHIQSPLLMINRSCQQCHATPESDLKARVESIQDRHFALLQRAGQALVAALDEIKLLRKESDEKSAAAAEAFAKELCEKDPKASLEAEKKKKLTALWAAVFNDPANPQLKKIADLQRKAQWRLDFVAAENSMGFHAPQELARILGESIDYSRQAQLEAMKLRLGRTTRPAEK